MTSEITNEIEMSCEACVMQHTPSISAHWKNTAGLNIMMFIEYEAVSMLRNVATINYCLAMILT
jgi:hypothetical protein